MTLPLYDFSLGLNTKTPKERLDLRASSYCKNDLWDEKNRLSKVFGTTALLAAANNAFGTNPTYNLCTYTELGGSEVAIIQIITSSVMKLYRLRTNATTVTDITPAGVTLALLRRMNFATHKGLLYATNSVNDLLVGDANSTATWRKWHTEQLEKFRYITTHNYRLWMANSAENPIRVIYTGVNEEHFGAYYGDVGVNPTSGVSYIGNENWLDFPQDGTPITGICEFQDSLLVFKPYHIFRVSGDPLYGVTIRTVSDGVGCFAGDSIAIRKDATVFFLGHDGVYAYGDVKMLIGAEDQKAYAGGDVIRLTSEIDNYWDTNVTVSDPTKRRALVKSGATDFGNLTTKTNCTVRTPTVSTHRPTVLTMDMGSTPDLISQTATTDFNYVNLRSTTTAATYDPNKYYAQTFAAPGYRSLIYGVPYSIDLFLANNGTLTSTQKLNIFITATKTDERGKTVPDFSIVYAECQRALDDVDSANWLSDQDNGVVLFDYWDYPQPVSGGSAVPTLALVVKPVGDTDALYAKWCYPTSSGTGGQYASGEMVNSDDLTPASQADTDYTFKLYLRNFAEEAVIVTNAFDASAETSFVHWDELNIEMDDKTANGYMRKIKLVKAEYALSANGTDWGAYVTMNSLRDIASTSKYIRFKLTFRRATSASADNSDSFTIVTFKAFYTIQATTQTLVKGIMWDDRYILAFNIVDSGG